ncbi:MAG: hypothetical protein VW397_09220, partial [Candidatus Margulisiibacteriota bacterium]
TIMTADNLNFDLLTQDKIIDLAVVTCSFVETSDFSNAAKVINYIVNLDSNPQFKTEFNKIIISFLLENKDKIKDLIDNKAQIKLSMLSSFLNLNNDDGISDFNERIIEFLDNGVIPDDDTFIELGPMGRREKVRVIDDHFANTSTFGPPLIEDLSDEAEHLKVSDGNSLKTQTEQPDPSEEKQNLSVFDYALLNFREFNDQETLLQQQNQLINQLIKYRPSIVFKGEQNLMATAIGEKWLDQLTALFDLSDGIGLELNSHENKTTIGFYKNEEIGTIQSIKDGVSTMLTKGFLQGLQQGSNELSSGHKKVEIASIDYIEGNGFELKFPTDSNSEATFLVKFEKFPMDFLRQILKKEKIDIIQLAN